MNQGFAVLLIQFDDKKVSVKHFPSSQLDEANAMYSQVESTIDKHHSAVVMVSVSNMKELHDAYPSYFLNANEFINALQDFDENCRIKGYIK